jgi:hypothetical protein
VDWHEETHYTGYWYDMCNKETTRVGPTDETYKRGNKGGEEREAVEGDAGCSVVVHAVHRLGR